MCGEPRIEMLTSIQPLVAYGGSTNEPAIGILVQATLLFLFNALGKIKHVLCRARWDDFRSIAGRCVDPQENFGHGYGVL